MRRALQFLAAFSALLLCGNQPLSSTESRLVGKWRIPGKLASIDLTFRADHSARMVTRWAHHEYDTHVSNGRWSAKGDRLFLDWYDNPDVVRQMRKEPTKIVWRNFDVIVLSHPKDPNQHTANRVK
jgi:hypothetical protein